MIGDAAGLRWRPQRGRTSALPPGSPTRTSGRSSRSTCPSTWSSATSSATRPCCTALLRLGGVIEDDPAALGRPRAAGGPTSAGRIVWDNLVGADRRPGRAPAGALPLGRRAAVRSRAPARRARRASGAIAGVRFERLTLRRTIVEDFYGGDRAARRRARDGAADPQHAGRRRARRAGRADRARAADAARRRSTASTSRTSAGARRRPAPVALAPGWTLIVTGLVRRHRRRRRTPAARRRRADRGDADRDRRREIAVGGRSRRRALAAARHGDRPARGAQRAAARGRVHRRRPRSPT